MPIAIHCTNLIAVRHFDRSNRARPLGVRAAVVSYVIDFNKFVSTADPASSKLSEQGDAVIFLD